MVEYRKIRDLMAEQKLSEDAFAKKPDFIQKKKSFPSSGAGEKKGQKNSITIGGTLYGMDSSLD